VKKGEKEGAAFFSYFSPIGLMWWCRDSAIANCLAGGLVRRVKGELFTNFAPCKHGGLGIGEKSGPPCRRPLNMMLHYQSEDQ
jgi:hypothetical protein